MTQIVTADFETYYSREFSLTKMTTEEYVRSDEFETIGVSLKFGDADPVWYPKPQVAGVLKSIDWSDKFILCQNTAFDAAILNWRYGVNPKGWLDTLGMSRALFPHEKSHSLKAQAERAGVGAKGDEVVNALGLRYADFGTEALHRYGEYCKNDSALTYALFTRYMGMGFPRQELELIDLTLRMFVEPVLVLDKPLLRAHLEEVMERKAALLDKVRDVMLTDGDPDYVHAVFTEGTAGIKKLLMSNDKFADLLRRFNVDPPMKRSPATGKQAYAFAKTDDAFKELAEHPDPDVQGLVAARLGNKTTIEETRTQRFIGMADRGAFPVPLRYYGAHSGRWCLTGDHEVLTPQGWVRLDEWQGQSIRQWDAESKSISWATPTMSSFDVDEPVVEFSGKYHRAVYTKEHRIPIRKRHTTDKVKDVMAWRLSELAKKELYVSGYAEPAKRPLNPDMLRLIVAMHADGYNVQDAKNNMVRFRLTRTRKVVRLRALLESVRIPYTSHNYPSEPHVTAVIVRGVDAPDWLRAAKSLPDWFYELGGEDASIVVSEMAHWDGYVATETSFEWAGKDEDAAKKYATLGHLCGYRVLARLRPRAAEGWADIWRLCFTKTTTVTDGKDNARWVQYTGKVFCPTVSTGYFLCRRQDTIFITGNSGQDSVNMQNLPSRGADAGRIKKAIKAPPGYVIIDCDSSQIEARTLAWMAGQDDLVQAFADKQDVYKTMASSIYDVPVADITYTQRQVGKTVILGCLGPDTLVLTRRGWIPILQVQGTDMVWDGLTWVPHGGVIPQGEKDVWTRHGLSATSDHEILTEHGWEAWSVVIENHSLWKSARSVANLLSLSGAHIQRRGVGVSDGTLFASVHVGGQASFGGRILSGVVALGATLAPKLRHALSAIGHTKAYVQTKLCARGYSTASHPVSPDVTTPIAKPTRTTADVGYTSMSHGGPTGSHFSRTCYHLRGMTSNVSNLIGLTWIKAMSRVIFASWGVQPTWQIGVALEQCRVGSQPLKQKMQTYDIAYAGPRNRYTVLTSDGPLIVHNCGYGVGHKKLRIFLKTQAEVTVSEDEAKVIIDKYRATYPKIPLLWKQGDAALRALALGNGMRVDVPGIVNVVPGKGLTLPSGLFIQYPNLQRVITRNPEGEEKNQWVYTSKGGPIYIYGGKVVENFCQAVARCIVAEQMLRVSKRYKVVLTVHDAIASLAKDAEAQAAQQYIEECMSWVPKWATGLPLACESGVGSSYGDC